MGFFYTNKDVEFTVPNFCFPNSLVHFSWFFCGIGYGPKWKLPFRLRNSFSFTSSITRLEPSFKLGRSKPWSSSHSNHFLCWCSVMK